MSNLLKMYFAISALGIIVCFGLISFILVSTATVPNPFPCRNKSAVAVAQSLENPDDWEADTFHVTRKSDGLSIWYANGIYGLGIDRDGYAIPHDGDLSLVCKALIFNTLYPRTETARKFK